MVSREWNVFLGQSYSLVFSAALCVIPVFGTTQAAESDASETENSTLSLDSTIITATEAAPDALPPAYGGGQVARGGQLGILGNQDIMDVPFTTSSYTSKLIEDQQGHTVGDVLSNDSSVRVASGYGNAAQVFVIRGFPLTGDDISYNGLYGVIPRQLIATEAVERVEVFKGPNAFINGVTPTGSGIGGGVNIQPKRAEETSVRRFTTDFTSDGQLGQHLDIGERIGEDDRFGVRLNLAQREGDTSVDDESQRTKLFALGLDYRGDRFRVSGDFGYQKQRLNGDRNVVYVGSSLTKIPEAPSADTNYGHDWTKSELEDTFGMLRGEYDISENWTAYAAAGAKHTHEAGTYSSPTLIDSLETITSSSSFFPHDEDNRSAMGGLRGHLQTGLISHQINLGVAGIWAEQRSAYLYTRATRYTNNLYHPVPNVEPPLNGSFGGDVRDPNITGKTKNRSIALSDTLGFLDDRILLTAGVRRQSLNVSGWGYNEQRNARYNETITTPIYGIVIKPWDYISFYANRIEGLAKGPTAPATGGSVAIINKGEVFPPARSKQVEAGVKLDLDTFGASLGIYQIEQPADGYIQGNMYVREGEQRNRGVELNVYGEPWQGLRLLAGATLIDTKLKDTQGGNNDGNHAIGVPDFQYNLGVDWDVPGLEGAALNARMVRTGGQYADAANNLSIPAWTRVDLGARYGFKVENKDVTLRANVENVANKAYWQSAYGGYLTQGEPRTVKLSASIDF
jgi:iron complex outermembrane receptor protein